MRFQPTTNCNVKEPLSHECDFLFNRRNHIFRMKHDNFSSLQNMTIHLVECRLQLLHTIDQRDNNPQNAIANRDKSNRLISFTRITLKTEQQLLHTDSYSGLICP